MSEAPESQQPNGFGVARLEFDRFAKLVDESRPGLIRQQLADGGYTDVLVLSHGWNNDMAQAEALYADWAREMLAHPAGIHPDRVLIIQVFWPSKRFADADLIPGGAAALGGSLGDEVRQLADIFDTADERATIRQAAAIADGLDEDGADGSQFADVVALIRRLLGTTDADAADASDRFFAIPATEMLRVLGGADDDSGPLPDPERGGAAVDPGVGRSGGPVLGDDIGTASAGLFSGGLRGAGRRFKNYVTYYEMKARSGLVGERLGRELAAIVPKNTRLHLAGHSFGGRLVTAAAQALAPFRTVSSLTLIQAAFSHYGFAENWVPGQNGFFRSVLTSGVMAGPISVTHTRNDRSVGILYAIASRLANQSAAMFQVGGPSSRFGGIGSNGAQRTPEARSESLLAVGGSYEFAAGALVNLESSEFIAGHSKVHGPEVGYLLASAVASASASSSSTDFDGFDPESLNRSVISIPLLKKAGSVDPTEKIPVVIDINLDFKDGRQGAIKEVIRLISRVTDQERVANLEELQGQYVVTSLTMKQIEDLVAEDGGGRNGADASAIFHVWPDFTVRALLDRSTSTVKADAARTSFAAHGSEIVWAVLDSGIAQHSHFTAHQNLKLPPAIRHRDFVARKEGNDALVDPFGHGTHVAGIIAGYRHDEQPFTVVRREMTETRQPHPRQISLTEIAGVAPQCKLVSYRVLDENGFGSSSSILQAIEEIQRVNNYGRSIRIHGVNISVGYPFDPEWFACGQSPVCVEVDRLVRSGVVVVVAAGNTGYAYARDVGKDAAVAAGRSLTINDPGNADRAITVGSTHRDMPHVYGVSYFSSKGPTGDGRPKPDLVAPGERILSCATGTFSERAKYDTKDRGPQVSEYVEYSGTSMAAPHVSGVIAGFLSVRREFIGRPEEVKRIFTSTATDLHRAASFQGHGLVDLMRAIQSV